MIIQNISRRVVGNVQDNNSPSDINCYEFFQKLSSGSSILLTITLEMKMILQNGSSRVVG